MKQFNGLFSCTFCCHPTENISGYRKYPMSEDVSELRTHNNIIQDMVDTQKYKNGKLVFHEKRGVKGPSVMMNLEYFNLSDGMTPDSMHSVYLGVTEQITNLILSKVDEPYYVGSPNNVAMINERLTAIKVPQAVTRTPRSIGMKNLWKASEWRSWLFFYCIPCLQGILPEKYLLHLSKFVAGIEILSRSSICTDDISRAQNLLVEFCVYF